MGGSPPPIDGLPSPLPASPTSMRSRDVGEEKRGGDARAASLCMLGCEQAAPPPSAPAAAPHPDPLPAKERGERKHGVLRTSFRAGFPGDTAQAKSAAFPRRGSWQASSGVTAGVLQEAEPATPCRWRTFPLCCTRLRVDAPQTPAQNAPADGRGSGGNMPNLESRLNSARAGGALLFCGAGFTADCLNFNDPDEIGVGAHLLAILNNELARISGASSKFKQLQNAAAEYKKRKGEHQLLDLLRERFRINKVSEDMVDIALYPWGRVYTTNYDNGIELAFQGAAKKCVSVNNLDSIGSGSASNSIIHLHGYIEKWDIRNFTDSCVLDAGSYMRLSGVSDWLDTLRSDIHRSPLVVFVGFSAADFHLARVIYDVAATKDKIYFVNQPAAEPDPDVKATQELFGESIYIGRPGFAKIVRACLKEAPPAEPRLASFARYVAAAPAKDVIKVSDIEDLFLFGRINRENIARDLLDKKSSYHVRRSFVDVITEKLRHGTAIALLTGDICDGKSITLDCVANELSGSRPVYWLRHAYEDMLDEVSRILHVHTHSALVVENCFDLRDDRLAGLARLFTGTNGVLLLSSRSISTEAEGERLEELREFKDFHVFEALPLSDSEISALVNLTDQIAGWRNIPASTTAEQQRFVSQSCRRSLPSFLLRLLKSKYVRDRYREEFNKSSSLSRSEQQAVILALYLTHMGEVAPTYLLSNALEIDVGGLADRLDRQVDGLRLVHRRGDSLITVPSIGATNILEHMVSDAAIVDSVVNLLGYMALVGRRTDFEKHIFGQLMRHSILRSVVGDAAEIDRFFDNVSRIAYFRKQVLFWLQWHIAEAEQSRWLNAEKYLDNSYKEAKAYEGRGNAYDRKQLDDRRAKFLMMRALKQDREPSELFRDVREAMSIVRTLLGRKYLTHHPYETLVLIHRVLERHPDSDPLFNLARREFDVVRGNGKKRLGEVAEGYQRNTAAAAINAVAGVSSV